MFSYYGGKSKIIKYYPEPIYDTIIEPFAGSARYSLRFFEKNYWLNDSYKIISDIWNWIINLTPKDIAGIPELHKGDDLRNLDIDPIVRSFLGFVINSGVAYPHNVVTKWCEEKKEFIRHKARLLKYCGKLTHWKVTNLDYLELPDIEATWFIDPPYQNGGDRYIKKDIDYNKLAEWCLSRKGQVIVCENSSADWMPFKPLKELYGQKKKTLEVIWYKEK